MCVCTSMRAGGRQSDEDNDDDDDCDDSIFERSTKTFPGRHPAVAIARSRVSPGKHASMMPAFAFIQMVPRSTWYSVWSPPKTMRGDQSATIPPPPSSDVDDNSEDDERRTITASSLLGLAKERVALGR